MRNVFPLVRVTTAEPRSHRARRGLIPGPGSLVGLMHLHGNHSNKLPTALPAEAPGFWAMDVSVRFQILSCFPATRVSSHRSKDHRQRGDPTVITAHPASSCSCRAGVPASPNPRQSSIHSSESRLQAAGVAICHGSFSPACSPLPGAWLIQQQN